jgi:hypothetical protein
VGPKSRCIKLRWNEVCGREVNGCQSDVLNFVNLCIVDRNMIPYTK